MAPRRRLPKYVQSFTDRHDHARYYFRRGAYRCTLPGAAWSPEFMAAHAAAMVRTDASPLTQTAAPEAVATPPAQPTRKSAMPVRAPTGSMTALIAEWKLAAYSELAQTTRTNYTRITDRLERSVGHLPVDKLTESDIQSMIDQRTTDHGIEAGNTIRRIFRLLMPFAKKRGYRADNPMLDIRKKKRPKGQAGGWATLGEPAIQKYVDHWRLGTPQYLAMALLVCTGQRRSDVVKIGPHNIVGKVYDPTDFTGRSLAIKQQKTGKPLIIPIAPMLQEALTTLAAPANAPAFLLSQRELPFKPESFTNVFSEWTKNCGIEGQASPHTLRKAAARRLAEAGATVHQIAAITGHDSLAEVERYTKAAGQEALAITAIGLLHPSTG